MYSNGNIHEKNVLARITNLAHRWSKLEIQGRQYENFPPAFPALRTLTASYIFTGDVYFFDAPLLRTVRLGDSVALHSFVLPSHITHLSLSRLCVEDFPCLKLYPSLVELHFKSVHFYDGETPLTITHPTIRCLSVSGIYLLSFLILPALEDLRIQRSESNLYVVSAFLSQSGCSLKTLAIDVPCDDRLSGLLGTQPSLQGLSIMSHPHYRSLDLVYRRLACPDFLSNLERFRIIYADDLYPQAVHMIRARWYAPIRRLRNFVVVADSVKSSRTLEGDDQ
ncbi:uncharacterized protein EV420DRAFT_513680 [Desarmillaria tabescens]|uniref:Uncharacterized protein n=1 Tax=Armillaria tabescens TaxID=1929756 RepID=A0AA39K9Z5_ARMTA|nr:uncharacterized protein EV420DRAFT_513680 [Desarmillaria tabescens]KAK0457225.1 hypothetical protein EV420DRAFT_513680 [Desarmillaria tabescens]